MNFNNNEQRFKDYTAVICRRVDTRNVIITGVN